MSRKRNSKKKSPSDDKYDRENPTVSSRIPRATRDNLYANLAKRGMSLADAMKVLAGEIEVKGLALDLARGEGMEYATKLYRVTYACSDCNGPVHLTGTEAKKAAARYMTEHGWHHRQCPPQQA